THIPNNNSGIDLVKAEDALYLVLNPVSGNWAARTPLSIYKSTDNGKTFEEFAVLADEKQDPKRDKGAEFSYPAVIYKNGSLHLTFTWMRRCIAYAKIDL
ncbi:MAG: exo-alpha-sialidase, partial [Clostridia bacterium]|nr:exo-alpha-sialidase [Clostridia bacterium]